MILGATLSLALFGSAASASMFGLERDDTSDYNTKLGIQTQMARLNNETGQHFQRQRDEIYALVKSFQGVKEEEITRLFSPAIEQKPKTFSLPLYDGGGRIFPGLFALHPFKPSQAHQSFYQIGDFAGAKAFYGPDGQSAQTVVFYFCVDQSYPELKGWSDLKARIQWDDAHFARLQAWAATRRDAHSATPESVFGNSLWNSFGVRP